MTFTGAMTCVIVMALCVFCIGLYLLHLRDKNHERENDHKGEA